MDAVGTASHVANACAMAAWASAGVTPGTPRYAVLAPGDTIRVAPSLDYEDVLAKAASAVDDVVGLTRDLHVITGGLRRGARRSRLRSTVR